MYQILGASTGRGWGDRQEVARTIRFELYNIRNVRNRGIKSMLCRMSQANIELSVFQETKVMGWIYTSNLGG